MKNPTPHSPLPIPNNPSVCLYFQVHQPYRLKDLRISDVGSMDLQYFDVEKNRAIFRKVAEKCYLPANAVLLELLQTHPNFRAAFSLSGVFLDQCKEYGEDVLESFRKLAETGQVEFLAETYYHSLSCLTSLREFLEQVSLHVRTIEKLFGTTPKVLRNTELIYRNELAHIARLMGFSGILAEGADRILGDRSPNQLFAPPKFSLSPGQQRTIRLFRPFDTAKRDIRILLKNYRLSDDVAFRFSDKSWIGFPLTAERFTDWLLGSEGFTRNLFMDYETFGEHQWADTGIFDFLRALPRIWQERGIATRTPSETIDAWNKSKKQTPCYDAHEFLSWADQERDLSAWQGNRIQTAALQAIHALEKPVRDSEDPRMIDAWRKLQTSDHFYYMCTKYWSDGDVHKYFSPYESPYEAYRRFSHALCDLRICVERMSNYELEISNPECTHDPHQNF